MPADGDDSAGDALPAREWEANWLDQAVAALNFRTPRQAAHGDEAGTFRVEALLRQLEYQAGLATARGQRGIDVAWLRAELGLPSVTLQLLAAQPGLTSSGSCT